MSSQRNAVYEPAELCILDDVIYQRLDDISKKD